MILHRHLPRSWLTHHSELFLESKQSWSQPPWSPFEMHLPRQQLLILPKTNKLNDKKDNESSQRQQEVEVALILRSYFMAVYIASSRSGLFSNLLYIHTFKDCDLADKLNGSSTAIWEDVMSSYMAFFSYFLNIHLKNISLLLNNIRDYNMAYVCTSHSTLYISQSDPQLYWHR